jgi:hypothetical protein
MTIWFPAVEALGLPHPRTKMLDLSEEAQARAINGEEPSPEDLAAWLAAATEIGYPLFLRSDLTSGKHRWLDTCYVAEWRALVRHVFAVIEDAELHWVWPVVALAFREFVPLDSSFAAFNAMPVSRERRYFAEDGEVRCSHPYWPEGAIAEHAWRGNLPKDWRDRLRLLNEPGPDEGELATMAAAVTRKLGGAWSVDFAKAKDGRWLLIDMARAGDSYHEEEPA